MAPIGTRQHDPNVLTPLIFLTQVSYSECPFQRTQLYNKKL